MIGGLLRGHANRKKKGETIDGEVELLFSHPIEEPNFLNILYYLEKELATKDKRYLQDRSIEEISF